MADQAIDLWWTDKTRRPNKNSRKNTKSIVKVIVVKSLFWMIQRTVLYLLVKVKIMMTMTC